MKMYKRLLNPKSRVGLEVQLPLCSPPPLYVSYSSYPTLPYKDFPVCNPSDSSASASRILEKGRGFCGIPNKPLATVALFW